MLFLKKTVQVPQQTVVRETQVVQPVVQPQRTVVVDRTGITPAALLAVILGVMAVLAMALYFWWYRPNYVEVAVPTAPVIHETRVVEKPSTTPPTVIVHDRPVVQMPAPQIQANQPPVVVQGAAGSDIPEENNKRTGTTGSDTGSTSSGTDGQ
jgi:hypothetical protein